MLFMYRQKTPQAKFCRNSVDQAVIPIYKDRRKKRGGLHVLIQKDLSILTFVLVDNLSQPVFRLWRVDLVKPVLLKHFQICSKSVSHSHL